MFVDNIKEIEKAIGESDKVLVGIGNEFGYNIEDYSLLNTQSLSNRDEIDKYFNYLKLLETKDDKFEKYDCAYSKLKSMLEGKDYYIISLLMDDLIYRTFEEKDKIVTPLGGFRHLQCEMSCDKDGAKYLCDARKIINKGIISENDLKCPNCGSKLIFNNVYAKNYVEEGYLNNFSDYKKWLTSTINKKLCIIEIGCDLKFPSIIRMAFDKIAFYNQKCTFFRIHSSLYQHTQENSDKGISVKCNALQLFTR